MQKKRDEINCIYLGAEVSDLSLLQMPTCIFTLLANISIPETLHSVDTAEGYTSLITADSVTMSFPLRQKLLSSAPGGSDMMTDKERIPNRQM